VPTNGDEMDEISEPIPDYSQVPSQRPFLFPSAIFLTHRESQILIKTIEATPITSFDAETRQALFEQEVSSSGNLSCWTHSSPFLFSLSKPNWYEPLDTIPPGWTEGIRECNKVLHQLARRRYLIWAYRIFFILLFLAGILILMLNFNKSIQPIIFGFLFPVLVMSYLFASIFARWIISVKSPLPQLRGLVAEMGWSLEGFEEPCFGRRLCQRLS
jgi:hypothetical protein